MDPLTITTGVITLLQATTSIISICYDFRAALKDLPWSLIRLIDELKGLRSTLETLDKLVLDMQGSSRLAARKISETLLDPGKSPLVLCSQELNILDKKMKSISCLGIMGRRTKAAVQVLKWRLTEAEVKNCLDRIERCKSSLSLVITEIEAEVLVDIQDLAVSVQSTVSTIDSKVTFMTEMLYTSCEHEALLRWLSTVDPYANHESASSAHSNGTSKWIRNCEKFKLWSQFQEQFLWLSGCPGAGKTILFSHIVSYLISQCETDNSTTGIAYFYCDFTREEYQCARNIIGSLVAQLCSQFPYPASLVLAFQSSQNSGKKSRPTWAVLEETLLWFAEGQRVLLLMDALDECNERTEVLNFFSKMKTPKLASRISVLFTAREEGDIEADLQSVPKLRLETYRNEINDDIALYIRQRLTSERSFLKLSETLRSDIQVSLNEKSAGMFRWAQCQLDSLSQLRTAKAIRSSLTNLPKGLHETYKRILKKANGEDIELLRRILLWVGFASTPLTIAELHDAIAVDVDLNKIEDVEESRLTDAEDIFSIGGSLISISDGGQVKLAHLSVKDYLLSQDIRNDPEVSMFWMDHGEANQELALRCIAYLTLQSLSQGPATTLAHWTERRSRHRLLNHAAKCWTYYYRAAEPIQQLNEFVSDFFAIEPHRAFMSWIQVLNSNWIFKWNEYPRNATPLYYAASFGLESIVETMVRNGANINAPGSRFGGTALHGATLREHIRIVKFLLGAGADPRQADFNLIAPLHTAARIGNHDLLKLLLDHGASKHDVDSLGKTPCDWAMESGQEVSQKILRGDICEHEHLQKTLGGQRSKFYERPLATFPALAVAQGLSIPSGL